MAYAEPHRRAELVSHWSWQNQEDPLARAYAQVAAPGPGHREDPFPAVHVDWN